MQFQVPESLESKRLILRQFKETDWLDLHQYYSDPRATKYTVGRAFTEEETWRTLSMMIGHWQLRGYGPYAVVTKETDRVIGTVGFWYPKGWPSPEIKWALAAEYWGKGFASEAAHLIQITGRRYLPDIQLISLIHPENRASIKLAESIGAQFEKEITFRGANWPIYRHPTDETSDNEVTL